MLYLCAIASFTSFNTHLGYVYACLFPHICMQHALPRLTASYSHSSDSCCNAKSFDSVIQITQPSCYLSERKMVNLLL